MFKKKWFEMEMHRNWCVALCIALADTVVLRVAFYANPLEVEQAAGVVIIVAGLILAIIHDWMDTLHKRSNVNAAGEMWLYIYVAVAVIAVVVLVCNVPEIAMVLFVVISIFTGMAVSRHLRDVYCPDDHKLFESIQKSVIAFCKSQREHQGGV